MTYSDEVLADNPQIYWRLGEASGDAIDSSGNGRHGTVVSPVARAAASLLLTDSEGSIDLPASGGRVVAPAAAWADAMIDMTIEMWVRLDAFVGADTFAARRGGASNLDLWQFRLANVNTSVEMLAWSTTGTLHFRRTLATGLVAGTVYHLVYTKSGNTSIVYLNGVAQVTYTSTPSGNWRQDPTVPITMGGHSKNNAESMDGRFDEFAIYDYALSAARVLAHYTAGTSAAVTHDLSGLATSSSSANSTLNIATLLTGSALSTSSTLATIRSTLSARGTALSTSLTTGSITSALKLSGAAQSLSSTQAVLTRSMLLEGSALSVSRTFFESNIVLPLIGSARSTSSTQSNLTSQMQIAGQAHSASLTSAEIALRMILAGSAASTSSSHGAIVAGLALAALSRSISRTDAIMLAHLALSGGAVSTSRTWFDSADALSLSGRASSTSSTQAALIAKLALTGQVASQSFTLGEITSQLALTALTTSLSRTFAELGIIEGVENWLLMGRASSTSQTKSTLTLEQMLHAIVRSQSSAEAELNLHMMLEGFASSTSFTLAEFLREYYLPALPIIIRIRAVEYIATLSAQELNGQLIASPHLSTLVSIAGEGNLAATPYITTLLGLEE